MARIEGRQPHRILKTSWIVVVQGNWQLCVLAILLLGSIAIPLRNDPYYVSLGTSTLMAVYLASCWNLAGGYGGLLSLGHAAFFGIGAYSTAYLYTSHDVNPWLGLLAGAVLSAIVAILIALCAFRFKVKGFYFALLTFAVALLVPALVLTSDALGGAEGIFLPLEDDALLLQMSDRRFFFWVFFALVIIVIAITTALERSPLGTKLRAVREDEDAAESLGVPAARLRLLLFAGSAALTAFAGGVFTFQTLLTHTETSFDLGRFFNAIVAVIVGGQGTLAGPVFGVIALTGINESLTNLPITSQQAAALAKLCFGCLLIATGLLFSRGIVGLIETIASRVAATVGVRPDSSRAQATVGVEQALESDVQFAPSYLKIEAANDGKAPALSVRGLTKRFGGLVAVDDVSFDVKRGQILALIGPNGAGKSTVLEMCAGAQQATGGDVYLDGHLVTGAPPHRMSRMGLGRTFQNTRPFTGMTVLDNVLVATSRSAQRTDEARSRALECLELVGLLPAPGPYALGSHLSTGQRKRLEVARALGGEINVLLLDEPFGGLDERSQGPLVRLLRFLSDQGMAIVLVEHKLGVVAELADDILALERGRVIARGTPEQVLSNDRVIESYIGGKPHAN
ncbi:MAG: ATP-binding cassette domain-containing protein [Dehalococcoidia bacterium]